jgi:tight adherence protein B
MYIWLLCFLTSLLLIVAPTYWVVQVGERRRRFKLMLTGDVQRSATVAVAEIFNNPKREQPPFERLMARLQSSAWLSRWTKLPGTSTGSGKLLAASFALAATGGLAGRMLGGFLGPIASPLAAAVCAALPFLYLRSKSGRFVRAFEEQLPDAVDFLARSLRSGTALSLSLESVVAETSDPIKSQFLAVTRELALGAPIEVALKNLLARVPLLELRFLVAAILLQRETGGNLGEILDKLGLAIRDRLQLKAKIRASSAQGRLTARILSVLPVAVLFMISLISPVYLRMMTSDPSGRAMLMAALISQIFAYVCMSKITDIEI